MFRKIELWVLLLIVIALLIGALAFGALVRHALVDEDDAGPIARTALFLAEIPHNLRRIYILSTADNTSLGRATPEHAIGAENELDLLALSAMPPTQEELMRFDGRSGFTVFSPDHFRGLLLLARSNPEANAYTTELFDLDQQRVLRMWQGRQMQSPHLGDNLQLTFLGRSGTLVSLDACNQPVFDQADYFYHHTFNLDADGNIWAIGFPRPADHEPGNTYPDVFFHKDFKDDTLVRLSPAGELLQALSLTRLLIDHDMHNLLFAGRDDHFHDDPLHINDVQPVLEDGPYFSKGQLFVSLGHSNRIILVDPQAETIEWVSPGFHLLHQHDVDIHGPNEISVFENNRIELDSSVAWAPNVIRRFNFATGQWRNAYEDIMTRENVRTVNQGLHEITPIGMLIEEQNMGRLLFVSEDRVLWEYVNRGTDGRIFQLHWSSIIMDTERTDAIRQSLESPSC